VLATAWGDALRGGSRRAKARFVPTVVHRRKAPRARRISDLFAGIRERRPLARHRAAQVVRCSSDERAPSAQAEGEALVRTAGLAKAGRAEVTRANSLAFTREARLVKRDHLSAVQFRLDGQRYWTLLLVPEWSCDRRCPSGSGRGKAPPSASERRVRGAGRREPAGLWPEKTRLMPGGSVVIEPQGS